LKNFKAEQQGKREDEDEIEDDDGMKKEVQSSCPDQPSRTQFGACRLTSKTLVRVEEESRFMCYREKEKERGRKESSSPCE